MPKYQGIRKLYAYLVTYKLLVVGISHIAGRSTASREIRVYIDPESQRLKIFPSVAIVMVYNILLSSKELCGLGRENRSKEIRTARGVTTH